MYDMNENEGGEEDEDRTKINPEMAVELGKTNFYCEGGENQMEEDQIDTGRQLQPHEEEEQHDDQEEAEEEKPPKPPVLPAPEIIAPQSLFLFATVFTIHSFIAGLAIGAFKEVKEIGLVAVIVIIQKIPIALSFGVMFLSAGRRC